MNNIIKNLLSRLKQNEELSRNRIIGKHLLPLNKESLIIGMLNFNENLILTGSTSLWIMGIMENRVPKDIDFGLRRDLNKGELDELIDFFRLQNSTLDDYSKLINNLGEIEDNLNYQFIKTWNGEQADMDIMWQLNEIEDYVKIDLFRKEFYRKQDIVEVVYRSPNLEEPAILPCLHPSTPISYKLRYALNPQVRARDKHIEDLNHINEEYHKIIKDASLKF